jgi:hypothetical protein
MTLDELIAALQEAKEHGIQGGRKVIIRDKYEEYETDIFRVLYDNRNVKIEF